MHELYGSPEQLTADQKIDLGLRYAELNKCEIADSTARLIALQYVHDTLPNLTRFAMTGAVDVMALQFEVRMVNRSAEKYDDPDAVEDQMEQLVGYTERCLNRGPQARWDELGSEDTGVITDLEPSYKVGPFVGTFPTKEAFAVEMFRVTGVYDALQDMRRRLGAAIVSYVHINEAAFARQADATFVFFPRLDRQMDIFCRE